jgi:hypothetical protein
MFPKSIRVLPVSLLTFIRYLWIKEKTEIAILDSVSNNVGCTSDHEFLLKPITFFHEIANKIYGKKESIEFNCSNENPCQQSKDQKRGMV